MARIVLDISTPDDGLGDALRDAMDHVNTMTAELYALTGWTWQGVWSSATAYVAKDVVFHSGSSYLALLSSTNVTPGTDGTKWALLSQKGDTGPTGPAGADGATGPAGSAGSAGSPGPAAWTPPAAWASSTAYVVGPPASCVVYQGETYVCTTAHTSTGTFDASKFQKVAQKGAAGAGAGDMLAANNLSDLLSVATARTNLGLGSAALLASGTASGDVPVLGTGGYLAKARLPRVSVTNADSPSGSTTRYRGGTWPDGSWIVMRWVAGVETRADISNNSGVANLAAAWSARASLTYA